MDRPVELNENVQVACLPDPNTKVYPTSDSPVEGYIVGWGLLDEYGSLPDRLQNAKVIIYNSSFCANVSTDLVKNWTSQICAGVNEGGVDSCQGFYLKSTKIDCEVF